MHPISLLLAAVLLTTPLVVAETPLTDAEMARVLALQERNVELIARIVPAYVRIGGGSGVVISPDGIMLTVDTAWQSAMRKLPKRVGTVGPPLSFGSGVIFPTAEGFLTYDRGRGDFAPRPFSARGELISVAALDLGKREALLGLSKTPDGKRFVWFVEEED